MLDPGAEILGADTLVDAVRIVPDTPPVDVTAPLAMVPTLDRPLVLKSMLDAAEVI